jgi:hypothetical protein
MKLPGKIIVRRFEKRIVIGLDNYIERAQFWDFGSPRPEQIKRDKNKPEVRTLEVVLEFRHEVFIDHIFVSDDESIHIMGKPNLYYGQTLVELAPDKSTLEIYYVGNKKNKPLSKFFRYGSCVALTPRPELNRYDKVYAIDTNKRKTVQTEKVVCYTSVVEIFKSDLSDFEIKTLHQHCNIKANIMAGNEELASILNLIHEIKDSNEGLTLIITDSDLGNLDAINTRKIPLFAGMFLPDNFTLAYANSDRGKAEYTVNRAMKACDDHANHMANWERDHGELNPVWLEANGKLR